MVFAKCPWVVPGGFDSTGTMKFFIVEDRFGCLLSVSIFLANMALGKMDMNTDIDFPSFLIISSCAAVRFR